MFVSNPVGLWWVAITCTLAAAASLIGSLRGVSEHRMPRLMLAIAVAGIAFSYWWDILGSDGAGAEMRRGAGYVLWPSLLWTAWSGMTYARRRDETVEQILGGELE